MRTTTLSEDLESIKDRDGDAFDTVTWFIQDVPEKGYVTACVETPFGRVHHIEGVARSHKKALQFAYENLAKWIKEQS